MSVKVDSWGSRVGLILAMAGNAVGLGNFLRFPVQAVQNGGGAFIIPYLICFLVMGIPLLFIEWSSGRFGGKFGNHSTPYILDSMVKGRILKYVGVFGIFTNIAVAAYYCYIESWTMSYVYHTLRGTFDGMSQAEVAGFFNSYTDIAQSTTGIPYEAVVFYVICLLLNTYILSKGIGGIEKVAKVGMPLLIIFGVVLAVRGLTLGTSGASDIFPDANAWDGLNFLWTPHYESILDLKVWMAAAGQIFFTLSVGMGTIHCYAAYIDSKDDIALNAVSAGFMNEFVEVVLGSLIVIPIAAGYLGLDWVIQNAGFGMAFQTMPYLFQQWGSTLAIIAGVCWFGLLFFAGITSSLAMGTPWMGFMRDEFGWSKNKGAWSFGAMILILGLPTVIFFKEGVFDEYDYWAGTVSLVVFAMFETILFSWIFGMDKGWREITSGADIKVPNIYKFIIKYITPVMLIIIFLGSLFKPLDNNWSENVSSFLSGNGWTLDNGSIIKTVMHAGIREQIALATDPVIIEQLQDKILYLNFARLLLVGLFAFISLLVYLAFIKRRREGRATL
ncbi:MAG TPA: sodium:calcium symporter [Flavobacterium sp.]|jgi:SNF family Na+-dependent transporter|uniref:sodium:calcium symporter n=1 Tax=Flavobacterium sp. TaxID=239 RepID=UPI001B58387C|nr:sodium:calcium symporter [Flavobacterium sp.]MBP6146091.1 sodium:calcium symporter [Flavobacterium sp.]MBP7181277.1 sodium:calcium symporter [Flavobacterium sp.]MBP7316593.1 sodium:calcium symporter [Flavobacterium sp.]MBP8886075.1 sodium:calcium symporter [Flavobacterium sp.]HRL71881.1 sodium:calcium symporter [Flavobacterium sp.]